MIKSAINVGVTIEGSLRKARYFKGAYYGSTTLGVTRDEKRVNIIEKWIARGPVNDVRNSGPENGSN
jgi:hypothetical protein